jgi:small GTP-binding protein
VLPVVALVGRPNVGKSTLFNALTRTRDALVADVPGLTRDRKYGYARRDGHSCVVIDTGGLVETTQGIERLMEEQSSRLSRKPIACCSSWTPAKAAHPPTSTSPTRCAAAARA